MGNEQNDGHRNKPTTTTNFLQMFCRLSLQDIKPCTTAAAAKIPAEPVSPRVSCIGQVKRTNRVVGFPSSHHRPRKSPFSAKTLLPNAALPPRPNYNLRTRPSKIAHNCDRLVVVVDVAELDPPLPVERSRPAPALEASIWKRRGKNGGEIERLRVEEIKLGNTCRFRSPSTP